jgi:hydroxymethylglutaryl-CoA lyase
MNLPAQVRIVEVGPRDGLQNESASVPAAVKAAFIRALARTGLSEIEVTSFVSPKWVPQLADAAQVLEILGPPDEGITYTALVPNEKGMERALAAGIGRVAVFTAASESFNRKNINAGIAESLQRFEPIVERAAKLRMSVRGYVSAAFVCPYEGVIDPDATVAVVRRLFSIGVDEVSLGDTIGAAVPTQVEELIDRLATEVPMSRVSMHFHDTRGTALPNVLAALQHGLAIFDSSAGGLGGCPYAPGATGNLATEDLVYFLEGMGIETGVSLSKVVAASNELRESVPVVQPSRVLAAERSKAHHPGAS